MHVYYQSSNIKPNEKCNYKDQDFINEDQINDAKAPQNCNLNKCKYITK